MALQNWMKETRALKHLNPNRVTGGAAAEKGGQCQYWLIIAFPHFMSLVIRHKGKIHHRLHALSNFVNWYTLGHYRTETAE